MKVRIAGVTNESVTDGPGLRMTLFFQGCPHACPGCHNPQTWNFSGGQEFDLDELVSTLEITPILSGVTFSGGEPFVQAEAAARIAGYVQSWKINLWVYTGYLWEKLLLEIDKPGYRDLMNLVDVIVDGPYREELRNLALPYRGSQNQRIILVRQSLEQNRVVEWSGTHSGSSTTSSLPSLPSQTTPPQTSASSTCRLARLSTHSARSK
jgi:anaerobic ribonucleoside-triphosphate reductase activating protein